jgi:hypothetical protein
MLDAYAFLCLINLYTFSFLWGGGLVQKAVMPPIPIIANLYIKLQKAEVFTYRN